MKWLLTVFMLCGVAYGQTIGDFRYDTTKFRKIGGYNEVKIQNKTKDTLGIFTNIGNGWGVWKRPRISGGFLIIGNDTLALGGGAIVPNDLNLIVGFPGAPTGGSSVYTDTRLIGLGGNITIFLQGVCLTSYGPSGNFTFNSGTGSIDISPNTFITGETLNIPLNQ